MHFNPFQLFFFLFRLFFLVPKLSCFRPIWEHFGGLFALSAWPALCIFWSGRIFQCLIWIYSPRSGISGLSPKETPLHFKCCTPALSWEKIWNWGEKWKKMYVRRETGWLFKGYEYERPQWKSPSFIFSNWCTCIMTSSIQSPDHVTYSLGVSKGSCPTLLGTASISVFLMRSLLSQRPPMCLSWGEAGPTWRRHKQLQHFTSSLTWTFVLCCLCHLV